MRKCVGCGEMKSKKEMMRVLKTTDEEFVLDATGKKNGRGAYLCFSLPKLNETQRHDADVILNTMLCGITDLVEGYSDFIELEVK